MTLKKRTKIILLIGIIGAIAASGAVLYMFFMPHRDIQSTKTDYKLSADALVNEYLQNADAANDKYLDEGGKSKVIEVTGVIQSITEDFNRQKVILLKSADALAGVRSTFTEETNASALKAQIGETVTIKGVIRAGAAYDEDLGLYENVILEKADIIK
ncbi:MAG: hypothetical protein COW03_11575 [Cytophagales bacterium CG12_big_fil_rev_8_21_14_0_65_40_12]|nr:MAG: hypothetical protein COW03_11575 [Cytophagales bacterium CG12_big_fil_rev_8_21_14_0_65_40_12]PIW03377.1 MAG: hypothetical protein COW40_15320 [Cytophagales bacterium CG17_big_fil_post_rev_8_21_14_2_50_40_13]